MEMTTEQFEKTEKFLRQAARAAQMDWECSGKGKAETVPPPIRKGRIRVYREDNGEVLYRDDNVITNVSRWLFSTFMATGIPDPSTTLTPTAYPPLYGVWGLALGSGSPAWAALSQPVETAAQTSMVQEIGRIQLSRVNFVDSTFAPVNTLLTNVDFQTTVNATVNNITQGIREMGLIGGGNTHDMGGYTMQTAPYFSGDVTQYASVLKSQQTVILLNYRTLPPLLLPPGVNVIFSWIFQF